MSDHYAVLVLACALVTLTGVLIAAAAGYLARRDHASYPAALTRAAVAFTVTLSLASSLAVAVISLARR